VTLDISVWRDSGEWVALSVRDEGIGIAQSDVPHVFELFRRGGNVGPIRGTGIGLASARQIVEEHGGRITLSTREGLGSTFTVWLPLASDTLTQPRAPALQHPPGCLDPDLEVVNGTTATPPATGDQPGPSGAEFRH
jgi:K+-sensing histidine kinase KdpD